MRDRQRDASLGEPEQDDAASADASAEIQLACGNTEPPDLESFAGSIPVVVEACAAVPGDGIQMQACVVRELMDCSSASVDDNVVLWPVFTGPVTGTFAGIKAPDENLTFWVVELDGYIIAAQELSCDL